MGKLMLVVKHPVMGRIKLPSHGDVRTMSKLIGTAMHGGICVDVQAVGKNIRDNEPYTGKGRKHKIVPKPHDNVIEGIKYQRHLTISLEQSALPESRFLPPQQYRLGYDRWLRKQCAPSKPFDILEGVPIPVLSTKTYPNLNWAETEIPNNVKADKLRVLRQKMDALIGKSG